MSQGSKGSDTRVYVGNLPPDIRTKDVEDLFSKYGKITFVDLKTKKGPPFAFVEFDDAGDAEDAVRDRDGYDYDGYRLRVEFPRTNGSRGGSGASGGSYSRGGGGGYGGRGGGGGGGGRGGFGVTKRTSYRVLVSGLPPTGSWQDLKDHMREAGDVCYADVFKDGCGVVEYLRYDDMKYALRKLDDSKFRSHEGEVTYVRVKEDTGRPSERNGRSSSRSRSRSRSTPPRRSRGSPTYSPARRSRSRSRSASSSSSSSDSSHSKSRSRRKRVRKHSKS